MLSRVSEIAQRSSAKNVDAFPIDPFKGINRDGQGPWYRGGWSGSPGPEAGGGGDIIIVLATDPDHIQSVQVGSGRGGDPREGDSIQGVELSRKY